MWALKISPLIEVLRRLAGVQLPAEFQEDLRVAIAEVPHLELAEGDYAPEVVGMTSKGDPKMRYFNNAVEKTYYDQCLGPRELEMR